MMMTLAKKGPELTALVRENRWKERLEAKYVAIDLFQTRAPGLRMGG